LTWGELGSRLRKKDYFEVRLYGEKGERGSGWHLRWGV